MRTQQIMFGGFILAVGTLISLIVGGAWLGGTETDIASSMTVFKQVDILGTWSVTVPNITFFITGAAAIMKLDFVFFNGGMAVVQWFLFLVFGLGIMWGIYSTVIGVIQGLFPR